MLDRYAKDYIDFELRVHCPNKRCNQHVIDSLKLMSSAFGEKLLLEKNMVRVSFECHHSLMHVNCYILSFIKKNLLNILFPFALSMYNGP